MLSFTTQFKGLITSSNILEQVEGACIVAKNVCFTRPDLIEPRHALPPIDLTAGPQPSYKETDNKRFANIFEWTNATHRSYILPLFGSGITNIGQLTGTLSADIEAYTYDETNATGNPNFTPSTSLDFYVPRSVQAQELFYVSANNGIWRATSSGGTLTAGFSKSTIMYPADMTATLTTTNTWLGKGKSTALMFLVKRQINSQQFIVGRASQPLVVSNPSLDLAGITLTITPGRFAQVGDIIEVYRTTQYEMYTPDTGTGTLIKSPVPSLSSFVKAAPDTQVVAAYTALTLRLTINDSGLGISSSKIDTESGPDTQGRPLYLTVGAQPPIASDVASFQSYTFYSNIQRAAVAPLSLTSLPSDNNTLITSTNAAGTSTTTYTFKALVGSTAVSPNTIAGAVTTYSGTLSNAPVRPGSVRVTFNTTGAQATDDGNGLFHGSNVTSGTINYATGAISLVFGSAPGAGAVVASYYYLPSATNAVEIDQNATNQVNYSLSEYALSFDGTQPTSVLKITDNEANPYAQVNTNTPAVTGNDLTVEFNPTTSDLTRFAATNGIIAFVNASTRVVDCLVSYLSKEAGSTTNQFTFKGYRYAGPNPTTFAGSTHYVYGITATDFTTVQVYGGDGASYFSLIPPKDKIQASIGTPEGQGTAAFSYSGGLLVNVGFFGLTKKLVNGNIRQTLQNLANVANRLSTSNYFFEVSGAVLPTVNLEGFEASTTAVYVGTNTPSIFLPTALASTNPYSLISENFRDYAGFSYSRLGIPDYVSRISTLAPEIIGDRSRKILRWAATTNDLFAFKEKEGIYRVNIQGGGPFPLVQSIVLVSNTTSIIATESMQEIDEEIYFLSDDGFYQLTSTSLRLISAPIKYDLQKYISTVDLTKVRSIGNRYRKEYIVYFPDVNPDGSSVTLTYNIETDTWSSSDLQFDASLINSANRLTTVVTDYKLDEVSSGVYPDTTNEINLSNVDPDTYSWQYLRQERFTGEIFNQVIDSTFSLVEDALGNVVYVFDLGSNNPNSQIDQYEELLATWSSIIINGNDVTLTRTGVTETKPLDNLENLAFRLKDKDLYLRITEDGIAGTLIPVTVTQISKLSTGTTSIVVTVPSDTGTILANQTSTPDALLVGVNSILEFRPFHAGRPQTNKRFSDMAVHMQDFSPTNVKASFAVDNMALFTENSIIDSEVVDSQTLYRTHPPLQTARGRFLRVRISHSTPQERFSINGLAVRYSDTNNTSVDKTQGS